MFLSHKDWLAFVNDSRTPPPGCRDAVVASWERSREAGVDSKERPKEAEPGACAPPGEHLKLLNSLAEMAFRGAQPRQVAWAVCDPDGQVAMVGSWSKQALDLLASIPIKKNVSMTEGSFGTNAVAMAMAQRSATLCVGFEHYLAAAHPLAAAASPFYRPDGTVGGYLALLGALPEIDVLQLRPTLDLLLRSLDYEIRLKRSKSLHDQLKGQLKRVFKEDNKPMVMLTREGYIRQINPAALKLFGLDGKFGDEKNLERLAIFKPKIKEVAQSAIPCSGAPMEIKVARRVLDVNYDRVPLFSDTDEFLGSNLVFHEKSERVNPKNDSASEAKYRFDDIIGRTRSISAAKELAMKVAASSVNVLLTGPSGTGKEMFAHSIHNASDREEHPFVAINCAAIPREIAESELFGYAPGSFTGASRDGKIGKLEAADQGTVFLDEIGDMPLELQAKLLRLLEERTITRIGGRKDLPVNIRVIAATNRNIPELVEKGEFREDLYYRLNVSTITLPSLADCRDDIPELALNFINYFNETMGKKVQGISPDVLERFKSYSWPGNIRELRNAIEFSVMISDGENLISWKDLPGQLRMTLLYREPSSETPQRHDPLRQERQGVEESEKQLYQKALLMVDGNRSEAAKVLNVGRSTLYRKLRKYKLD